MKIDKKMETQETTPTAIEAAVGITLSELRRARTTKPCYKKLVLEHFQIEQVLRECYSNEVATRGRNTQNMGVLRDVAKWLNVTTLKPWLIMYGTVGNGKTTTATAIKNLYEVLRLGAEEQLRNRFKMSKQDIKACEWMANLSVPTMLSAKRIADLATKDKDRYDEVKIAPILIIDDLGVEPSRVLNYGTEVYPIADILYFRYDKQMMTIMTTNKDMEQLRATYGERLADRMKESASRIWYNSESFR